MTDQILEKSQQIQRRQRNIDITVLTLIVIGVALTVSATIGITSSVWAGVGVLGLEVLVLGIVIGINN